jgi:hypothetical protein
MKKRLLYMENIFEDMSYLEHENSGKKTFVFTEIHCMKILVNYRMLKI